MSHPSRFAKHGKVMEWSHLGIIDLSYLSVKMIISFEFAKVHLRRFAIFTDF